MTLKLNLPKIIGHRGVRGYAPENTLAGLHTAADMGVSFVEFDVKLTRDGEPILFHDDDLHRITGRDAKVAATDWDEIRELDAGSEFGDSFIGESIPHLEDALTVCIDRSLGVNIEIKPCPGREVETAEVALDCATRIWPDDIPPPLISSFQYTALETARDMTYGWPRGFLIDESDERAEDWLKMMQYIEAYSINCNGNAATQEDIAMYLETGLPVLAYTINDPLRAQHLFDMGITSVFTDVPDIIQDILPEHSY